LFLSDLLNGAREAIARVVDNDIETPEPLVGRSDGRERGVAIGDVEGKGQDGVAVLGDEVIERRGVARGGGDAVARREGGLRERAPKPRDAPVMNQIRSDMGFSYPERLRYPQTRQSAIERSISSAKSGW
jgi:hypothetical protein